MAGQTHDSAELRIAGSTITLPLREKEFSTGSKGFWAGGKLESPDGKRYQLQVQAVEIGSKSGNGKRSRSK